MINFNQITVSRQPDLTPCLLSRPDYVPKLKQTLITERGFRNQPCLKVETPQSIEGLSHLTDEA